MPSIEQLRKLLDADPNDAFVLYGLAQEYAKAGEHSEAVALYDRCLKADPSYLYAFFHKARSLEASGRLRDASDTLEKGIVAAKAVKDQHAEAELRNYLETIATGP